MLHVRHYVSLPLHVVTSGQTPVINILCPCYFTPNVYWEDICDSTVIMLTGPQFYMRSALPHLPDLLLEHCFRCQFNEQLVLQ